MFYILTIEIIYLLLLSVGFRKSFPRSLMGTNIHMCLTVAYILLHSDFYGITNIEYLTPKLSEGRSDAFGFSSGYCAKFNVPKLFESKCLYLFSRLFSFCTLQILHGKPSNREKMISQRST